MYASREECKGYARKNNNPAFDAGMVFVQFRPVQTDLNTFFTKLIHKLRMKGVIILSGVWDTHADLHPMHLADDAE